MIDTKYILSFYCDAYSAAHTAEEFPHIFEGRNYHDVTQRAVAQGWLIGQYNITYCPRCASAFLEPLVRLKSK
jgi:hypothetical protein